MRYRHDTGNWLSGTALLCLALAACNKAPQATEPVSGAPVAALELATAAPPPPTYAPPASALPPASRPVAYRPSPEHWRYLTDAYGMSDAFADTPPDYTVAYDGEDPYVWRADDGAYRVVEWLPDGARYYYYEPGADEPFLIQDPDYSYAYDNGALVAVYTIAGALVADRIAAERGGYAARYYARAHDLYHAAVNDRRRAAYATNWQQRAPMIQAQHERWQRGRTEQPGWRDWNRAHQAQQHARWAPERQHRAAYAAALGAAGAAGAAGAMQHRDDMRRAQEAARANPQPPLNPDHGPGRSANAGRSDIAERHAEADRAQPGLLHNNMPPPQGHGVHPAMADRHEPDHVMAAGAPAAQPGAHGLRSPEERVAARQQIGHAEQAQRRNQQQAEQAQHQEQRQAQEAQRHVTQQVQQAQRTEMHAHVQRAQQAQQAQHDAMRAQQHAQLQAHAAAAAPHAEAPHAPPQHMEVPHPTPAPHAEAPHPQAPHPAPQQHGNSNGGGQKDDRNHH